MRMYMNTDKASKADIENLTDLYIGQALDGQTDPIELMVIATMMEHAAKCLKDSPELRAIAIKEAEKDKNGISCGCSFKVQETGTNYDYSKSQAWLWAKGKETEQSEIRKAIEATAKTLKAPAEIEINGATLEVVPPIKKSTTSLIITLQK